MKKILIIASIFLAGISLSPSLVTAQATGPAPKLDYSGIVKCDGVLKDKAIEPGRQVECNLPTLMRIINELIQWAFYISIPIATVLFSYAGLLYMTGVPGKISQANKIFTTTGIGFIIALSAWFAVRTVVGWFVEEGSYATQFLDKQL